MDDGLDCGDPVVFREKGKVVGGRVVVCADFEECGEGVELVFALVDRGVGV